MHKQSLMIIPKNFNYDYSLAWNSMNFTVLSHVFFGENCHDYALPH
jgi:hypothetical protein